MAVEQAGARRDELVIVDNPAAGRYEARLDGELAGYCEYRRAGGEIIFPHTETLPAFRGRGIADRVVRFAVDDARQQGLAIVPQCWFVEEFLEREAGLSPQQ